MYDSASSSPIDIYIFTHLTDAWKLATHVHRCDNTQCIRNTCSHIIYLYPYVYTCVYTFRYICICIYYILVCIHVHTIFTTSTHTSTGVVKGGEDPGCLKLQVIFRKRANNYRALLREMTSEDKASYGSFAPCKHILTRSHTLLFTENTRILMLYLKCFSRLPNHLPRYLQDTTSYAFLTTCRQTTATHCNIMCRILCAFHYLHTHTHAHTHTQTCNMTYRA